MFFPIGGLADIGEAGIVASSRYCRQVINFLLKPHERLCLFKVFDMFLNLTLVRINLFIIDAMARSLTSLGRILTVLCVAIGRHCRRSHK
jgi:hypothetical protein